MDTIPDVHQKFIKAYEVLLKDPADTKDSIFQLQFRSVPLDFSFLEKKPPKDYFSIEGILKENWISKYYDNIPSVLVYFIPFNGDWSVSEWTRRESLYSDKFLSLKALLSPREIKIVTIMVKIGSGALDKEVLDERLSTYKRHVQIDSKYFFFFNSSDFLSDAMTIKRVCKYLREFSNTFYLATIKRFKSLEKSVSEKHKGMIENMLLARLNFKIAFLNEFQGHFNYSLKHYRQAYSALSSGLDDLDDEMFDQFKYLSEIIHFKICNILFSNDSLEECFQQFKTHISVFGRTVSSNKTIIWRHYMWTANQYLVFSQLLDLYAINENLFPFAERSFYYQNAARYTLLRLKAFEAVKASASKRKSATNSSGDFRGLSILPSRFIGSTPLFLDPKFDQLYSSEESMKLFLDYSSEQELQVDHNSLVLQYLNNAIDRTTINHERKTGFLLLHIANLYMDTKRYQDAISSLWKSLDLLYDEKWSDPSISILHRIRKCSFLLGSLSEYLKSSFMVYSLLIHKFNSNFHSLSAEIRTDIEDLHLSVLSVIWFSLTESSTSGTLFKMEKRFVPNPEAFGSNSFLPIPAQTGFASFRPENFVDPFSFPYCVDVRNGLIEMFEFKSNFSKSSIALGERLEIKVMLISNFFGAVEFDRMDIYFIDNSHQESLCNNIRFEPGQTYSFTLDIEITEEKFTKFLAADSIFCIESIDLVWINENREVKLHLAGFPKEILKLAVSRDGHASLKDIFNFSRSLEVHHSYCQITKPKGVVELVREPRITEVVEEADFVILQDLIQRIDLCFMAKKSQMANVSLYLSSDRGLSGYGRDLEHEDFLFWLPDLAEILLLDGNCSAESPVVKFYPMTLNSSFQPLFPLKLNGSVVKDGYFIVPIFLRCKEVSSFSIKISIEFMASDIMKTPLMEDFQVKISVKSPLLVSYTVCNDPASQPKDFLRSDINQTVDANEIFLNSMNTLTLKAKCSNDLNDSVVIHTAHLKKDEFVCLDVLKETSMKSDLSILRLDEELITNIFFFPTSTTPITKFGEWLIFWTLSSVQPLSYLDKFDSLPSLSEKRKQNCGTLHAGSKFSWLVTPFSGSSEFDAHVADSGDGKPFYVQKKFGVGSEAVSSFRIPEFKVCSSIFFFFCC